jgi:hypothetical protein
MECATRLHHRDTEARENPGNKGHGFGRAFCLVWGRTLLQELQDQIHKSNSKAADRRVRPNTHHAAQSFLLFLPFPQGSLILHSFCTSNHQFSVAHDSEFAQSAHSANVRCIEPARDWCRAGGDRWFSRVNHREGFQKCASVRSRKLGRCGLLRESFPKKLDWRRPLTQSPQANVSESSIRGLIDDGVDQ